MDIVVAPESIRDFLRSAKTLTVAVDGLMAERLREIPDHHLTPAQLKLLNLVARAHAHTISEVATYLGVSAPAASKAVDKLVQLDLLRRNQDEDDRRATHLTLTESGCRLLARIEAARFRALENAFGDLSSQELSRVAKALDDLSAGLLNLTSNPDDLCLRCGVYDAAHCWLQELTGRSCLYHREQIGGQLAVGDNHDGPSDSRAR
ncbi:MAG: MarR family winged helix-turn-helix transcriptional regulator [Planctomycetota bacterium]